MSARDWTAVWNEERPRLFGIAYRILGSATDAEDVVQDTWIACQGQEFMTIRDPAAYMVRTVANRSLNALRDRTRRGEEYIGPWLPEPLVATGPDPAEHAEIADSLTTAALVMMESMSPPERTAFVLCVVFDVPAPEAAAALERTPAAVRQLVTRARRHAQQHAPAPTAQREHERVARAFAAAVAEGDVARVVAVLAPDVRFVSDGGGKAVAARRPVVGAEEVATLILNLGRAVTDVTGWEAQVNGRLGFVLASPTAGLSVYQFDVVDGRVGTIWVTRNPDKLGRVPRSPQAIEPEA